MDDRDRQFDICFVAPNAYPALSGQNETGHIGGAEVQQVHIARELARRSRRVAFVTHDHGQPDGTTLGDICVFKMCARDDGVAIVRFIHPRWTSLCAAMQRANAGVYYQRTGGAETGQVASWCRRNGRVMIAAVASDRDCTPALLKRLNLRERMLHRYGLQHADTVIAQTGRQVELLKTHFNVESRVIRSCAESPRAEVNSNRTSAKSRVLWVGRFSRPKRVDRLLELARACPNIQFDIVGGDAPAAMRFCNQLHGANGHTVPANMKFHGLVPHDRMTEFYAAAALLICTSDFEGFPNIFLEAWSHGVPVVSSVDPDGIIAGERLGATSSTMNELKVALESLLGDSHSRRQYSENAKRYFHAHHTVRAIGDEYESLLDRFINATA